MFEAWLFALAYRARLPDTVDFCFVRYLTIILRGRAGYRMIDNQRGA